MAHLPETVDELDESLATGDPVVRAPKVIVAMPEPPSFPRRALALVAALGLLVGGLLGLVGVGIVYATQRPGPLSVPRRAARLPARTHGSDGGVFALSSDARDGGIEAAPTAPSGPEASYVSSQQRIGRGRTLAAVLRALGLPRDLASRVVRALRPLVNMRALQPSDVVAVMRDPSAGNEVKRVEYRRSTTEFWAVTIEPDGTCTGERVEVVHTTARVAAGFRVDENLEASLRAAGLHPDITARLAEVFPLINLGRELRRGDVVRIIVEEERLNGSFFRYGRVEALDYRGAMGRRRAFFQPLTPRGGGDFFDAEGRTWERGPLRAPLAMPRLTSPFNLRRMHPVLHRIMPHLGCDFAAPMGEPVYAAADGTVLSVGNGGPAGNLVRIAHPALEIETGYAHLSRFAPGLRPGMRIRARTLIGYVGSTGRSTGPHLHMSVKRRGRFVDPQQYLGVRRAVPAAQRAEFEQNVARLGAELDAIRIMGEPAAGEPAAGEPSTAQQPATSEEPAELAEEAPPAEEGPPLE